MPPYGVLNHSHLLVLYRIALAVISLVLADIYAPNAAINGDMGWLSPEHRQWMCVARKWCRMANLDESLLASKIFQTHLAQCNLNLRMAKHGVVE